jgi:hypothetical protein
MQSDRTAHGFDEFCGGLSAVRRGDGVACRGVRPASTKRSNSPCSSKRARRPLLPVGSSPAKNSALATRRGARVGEVFGGVRCGGEDFYEAIDLSDFEDAADHAGDTGEV